MRGFFAIGLGLFLLVAAGTSEAANGKKSKALVMPLKGGDGVNKNIVDVLSGYLVNTVKKTGKLEIITVSDIQSNLELEEMKDALDCNDIECAAEIGGALNARYLLTGTVNLLGETLVLSLNLIDNDNRAKTARSSQSTRNDHAFYKRLIRMSVEELLSIKITKGPKDTTSSGFAEGLEVIEIPEIGADEEVVIGVGSLAEIDTNFLALLQVAKRIDKSKNAAAKDKASAWGKVANAPSGDVTIRDKARQRAQEWLSVHEAQEKQRKQLERARQQYLKDSKKLEKLLAFDDDVVSDEQKERLEDEFEAAYAPWEDYLDDWAEGREGKSRSRDFFRMGAWNLFAVGGLLGVVDEPFVDFHELELSLPFSIGVGKWDLNFRVDANAHFPLAKTWTFNGTVEQLYSRLDLRFQNGSLKVAVGKKTTDIGKEHVDMIENNFFLRRLGASVIPYTYSGAEVAYQMLDGVLREATIWVSKDLQLLGKTEDLPVFGGRLEGRVLKIEGVKSISQKDGKDYFLLNGAFSPDLDNVRVNVELLFADLNGESHLSFLFEGGVLLNALGMHVRANLKPIPGDETSTRDALLGTSLSYDLGLAGLHGGIQLESNYAFCFYNDCTSEEQTVALGYFMSW